MVYKIYADCKENGVSSCQWQEGTTDKRTSVEKPKRVDLKPDLVATVQQLIEEDDHITTSAVAEAVNISQPTASRIISKDLGFRKVSACFVPKLLTLTHKAISMDCARSFLRHWAQHHSKSLQGMKCMCTSRPPRACVSPWQGTVLAQDCQSRPEDSGQQSKS